MANYTIGDMIFETRIKHGYSQEELCFGICSTSSLSRIENNSQMPSKRVFDALMQRLGKSDSLYSAFISKEEMELYRLLQQLAWKIERLDFKNVQSLLEEIEKRIESDDILSKQYVLFARANLLLEEGGNTQEVEQLLLEAIRTTIPDFEPRKGLKRRLLTFNEITIINCLAIAKSNCGEELTGLKLLFDLKDYIEERGIDEEEKARKYPMIIYNITTRIEKMGMFQEAYNLCEQAITFCVEHNKLTILPYLLTNKACAAAEIHKPEEAQTLFQQAHTLFLVCKNEQYADSVKKECFSRYQIKIT